MAGMAEKMQEWRGVKMPRLREIREAKQITRTQLTKATGLDYSFIWRIEARGNGVGADSAEAIAACLGVTVKELTAERLEGMPSA